MPSDRRRGWTDFGPLYLPNLIAALIAGVGLVIGSIGPWATFFAMSRGGMDADGILTLILGIAATAALFGVLNLGFMGGKPKLMMGLSIGAATAGVLGAITGIADIINVRSRSTDFFGETIRPEVGWGLWLVLISSVALVATSIIVAIQARNVAEKYREGLL